MDLAEALTGAWDARDKLQAAGYLEKNQRVQELTNPLDLLPKVMIQELDMEIIDRLAKEDRSAEMGDADIEFIED